MGFVQGLFRPTGILVEARNPKKKILGCRAQCLSPDPKGPGYSIIICLPVICTTKAHIPNTDELGPWTFLSS